MVQYDDNKSFGPNGFNFSFLRSFWYLLKDNLRVMLYQFNCFFSSFPHNFSSYIVTLIPKIESSSHLGDFRPISLVRSYTSWLIKCWQSD